MDGVQIIPLSGRPLEFDSAGTASIRFPLPEYGFLLGQENEILEPLLQEIIDGKLPPERQPVLLYGMPGSGRTHLLKGMLNAWRKNQTSNAVRQQAYYSTCADFYRHFTDSVTTRTTNEFRRRCLRAKLILLDDLEQLLGKPAAQTELRLLLDEFAAGDGIIVLTAQTLPNDLQTGKAEYLAAELAVRIQGGTTLPIFPPGGAVRYRFLRDLALAFQIPIDESALKTAAQELTGTIPQLYAAVAQKYAETRMTREPPTAAFWLQFSRKQQAGNPQNLPDIAKRTATYFSLKLNDLKGESRCKTVALARCLAVYLARTQLRLTFKEIGHFFGKRDSSTVRHLFQKVQSGVQMDAVMRDHLFRLTSDNFGSNGSNSLISAKAK